MIERVFLDLLLRMCCKQANSCSVVQQMVDPFDIVKEIRVLKPKTMMDMARMSPFHSVPQIILQDIYKVPLGVVLLLSHEYPYLTTVNV